MASLKEVFSEMGFSEIKTLLNSGNVIFVTKETNKKILKEQIEERLTSRFGFVIPVIIRTHEQIQKLIDSDPFKSVMLTPQTRLYVTFLSEEPRSIREIPYTLLDNHLRILQVNKEEAYSVLILSKEFDTTKLMAMWEKELGKNITTRNWNTVSKLAKL